MGKGCIPEQIYGGEAVIPINRSSEHAPATTENFANCESGKRSQPGELGRFEGKGASRSHLMLLGV